MTKKLLALGGTALALLLVSSLWDPADARRGNGGGYSRGGGGGHGGRSFHGGGHGGRSFHGGGGSYRFHDGGGRRHAHRFHHDGGHRHSHRFHGHRHAYIYGVPYAYGYSDYYYSNGCSWLRQRALYTGSPHWWNRYYACIYGDGYYDY